MHLPTQNVGAAQQPDQQRTQCAGAHDAELEPEVRRAGDRRYASLQQPFVGEVHQHVTALRSLEPDASNDQHVQRRDGTEAV